MTRSKVKTQTVSVLTKRLLKYVNEYFDMKNLPGGWLMQMLSLDSKPNHAGNARHVNWKCSVDIRTSFGAADKTWNYDNASDTAPEMEEVGQLANKVVATASWCHSEIARTIGSSEG